jgi:methylmalonyl-CoA carboxyltransferase 5S subunit
MKAIEAGCDIVDTSISSLSLGPGHNPTESLIEMLEGTGYRTVVDMERVRKVRDYFNKVRPRYSEFLTGFNGVDTDIFRSQIPGGMISNMESQLKAAGRRRPAARSVGGSAQRTARRGLSAAGDALPARLSARRLCLTC